MDQYIVSARKYRPATFASVVGQQALTETLKNAIATGRLAHAYLFCGGRGVGKTSCARIFAKTINCSSRTADGEACGHCDSCLQFDQNRSMNIIELDAASHNGIDDIKSLIEQVIVPPTVGRYRVFIIDEVHMLSPSAFNAFLKTLEEPPAHAVFILATTEKHRILPTILSRCQIYDFNRITIRDMVSHMRSVAAKESIEADPAALAVIARKADGAMRDALSIFDQIAASTRGNITYAATIENLNVLDRSLYNRLLDAFLTQDVPAALLIYKEIRDHGFDSQFFVSGLAQYMRDLMVAADPDTAVLLEGPDDERTAMAERAAKLHPTFIYKAMEFCNDCDYNFRAATNKQFLVELTLIRLCQLFSPSSENNGDDEGQLKPLIPAASPTEAVAEAHAPAAAAPAAPTTAPAPTPAPGPAPQTPPAPAAGISLGGFSLRGARQHMQEQKAAAAAQTVRRSTEFAPEALLAAWHALPALLTGEPMLASIVQFVEPAVEAGATTFGITVPSKLQGDQLSLHKSTILRLLADALQNDLIDYNVVVDDTNLAPAYWPEKRVLDYMLEHHPDMQAILTKYKMRLI